MDFVNDGMVGEHSRCAEGLYCEALLEPGKENVGISNDKAGEKPARRKTKVS